jgi:predicted cobalt transporter CbtA
VPFSMFCVGNDNFHYSRSRIYTIGDVYEIRDGMSRLTTGLGEGAAALLRSEVEDASLPDTDYVQQTTEAEGQIIDHCLLEQGLTMALANMSSLRIALNARNEGMIWADSGFASVTLYSDDADPLRRLALAIHPALASAGLNGVGVLGHIGIALSAFAGSAPTAFDRHHADVRFMLNISLAQV